jgi:hypothetical protein
MPECPRCATPYPLGTRFCPEDGTPLPFPRPRDTMAADAPSGASSGEIADGAEGESTDPRAPSLPAVSALAGTVAAPTPGEGTRRGLRAGPRPPRRPGPLLRPTRTSAWSWATTA